MIVKRRTFFLVLLMIVVVPILAFKVSWILTAKKAKAKMAFVGKEISGQLVQTYSVMMFSITGKDTVFFNTADQEIFEPGQTLPILYQPNKPTDARINMFWSIWMDAIIVGSVLCVILLIVFLHPEIIPYRSKVQLLKRRPFIRIL